MSSPSNTGRESRGPSHDRRTLLRSGAGLAALAATGGLAGCFGAPADERGDGLGAGDGGTGAGGTDPTYPVTDRVALLPADASMVSYLHLRALLADPVFSRVVDAYAAAVVGGFGGPDSIAAIRDSFDEAMPVAFDGLHELAMATNVDEALFGSVTVAWTDWQRDPVFRAARHYLGGVGEEGVRRRRHAGYPLVSTSLERESPGLGFAVGSLGDGRFAIGTTDLVERTHEVAAGQAEAVGGVLRDGLVAAPDGPLQAAVDPPMTPGGATSGFSDSGGTDQGGSAAHGDGTVAHGEGSESTTVVGATTTATGEAQTQPPTPTPPPETPPPESSTDGPPLAELLAAAYGGIYAEEDRRGLAVTLVGTGSAAADTLRKRAESQLAEWRSAPAGENPLRPALEDTTISVDGRRVTVRYEAPAEEVQAIAAAIEKRTRNRATPTPDEPGTEGPLALVSANGVVEAGGVGAVELVLGLREGAPSLDLRRLFVRFVGPDLPGDDYAFFHPDHEAGEVEDFGRFGTRVLGGEGPVLDAPDERAVLRFDLGADTPDDGVAPYGRPFPPGAQPTVVLGTAVAVSSVPLVVPESLSGEQVSLEPDA